MVSNLHNNNYKHNTYFTVWWYIVIYHGTNSPNFYYNNLILVLFWHFILILPGKAVVQVIGGVGQGTIKNVDVGQVVVRFNIYKQFSNILCFNWSDLVHLDQLEQLAANGSGTSDGSFSLTAPTNGSSGSLFGASGKSIQGVSNVTSSGSGSKSVEVQRNAYDSFKI